MSISENIAQYRKMKGYTQEQLGEMLGVTNQAVSKWESAVSMPDVMLLPKIADALGITLNDLYGITERQDDGKDQDEKINEFGASTQNLIKTHLYKQLFAGTQAIQYIAKIENSAENITEIKAPYTIGVIPYTADGAAFISDNLSVVSSDYDIKNGGCIFDSREIASGMKKLCDANVRKILSHMYSEAFKDVPDDLATLHLFFRDHDIFDHEFSLDEISAACNLSEEDTLEAIEKLVSLHIVEITHKDKRTRYIFEKTKGIETAVIFHAVERLIRETMSWGCGHIVGHCAE